MLNFDLYFLDFGVTSGIKEEANLKTFLREAFLVEGWTDSRVWWVDRFLVAESI